MGIPDLGTPSRVPAGLVPLSWVTLSCYDGWKGFSNDYDDHTNGLQNDLHSTTLYLELNLVS